MASETAENVPGGLGPERTAPDTAQAVPGGL
jgi:hypothetical protein